MKNNFDKIKKFKTFDKLTKLKKFPTKTRVDWTNIGDKRKVDLPMMFNNKVRKPQFVNPVKDKVSANKFGEYPYTFMTFADVAKKDNNINDILKNILNKDDEEDDD